MPKGRIIAFRLKEAPQEELNQIHAELGFGEMSKTLKFLLNLGITYYKDKQNAIERIHEEMKKHNIKLGELEGRK